jgi:NitT/TauT family transport system permease protein
MTTADGPAGTVTGPERATGFGRGLDWLGLGLGVAGLVGFLAIWIAVARSYPPYLVPAPDAVAETFRTELTSGRMTTALRQSLRHYVPGVAVGVLCGTSLGIATGWWRRLDDLLRPVTRIVRPIPPLAWVAFAIIWVGIGHLGAAFIVAIGTFWISYFNAYAGVENVPAELLEAAVVLDVTDDRNLLRRVVLPSSLPMILAGVRTSIGRGWMTVVAAELFGAPGIGYVILTSAQNLALEVTVSYMLLISAVYLVSDWGFRLLEGHLLTWRG